MPSNRSRDRSEPVVTFCVVGAGKAGTTWLFEVLRAHPDVVMARAKETMYFDAQYGRGVEWYHSMFPADAVAPTGEVSNTYLTAPSAPARIAAYNPQMQLIALLRDPVDRAMSNYLFFLRNGQVRGSFEEALEARPDLLDHGFYGRHLQNYLGHFPMSAVHLEAFDDLAADPHSVAARVLTHLGLPDTEIPAVAGSQVLAASAPRSRAVAAVMKSGAVMVRQLGAPGFVTRVKRGSLPRYLYRPLSARPTMSPETSARLRELYTDDVELLTTLTGRHWADLWWEREHGKALGRSDGLPSAPPEGVRL
ncbi:MAG: sulfotransferase family protein [Actinomycetes bacterium]